MQDSKTSSSRKPWYQRAMAVARFAALWKTIPKPPPEFNRPSRNNTINKPKHQNQNQNQQLRKCTSLKVAANSFTRVCLCAPIGPYDEVFRSYVPPRRSSSYPPSKPIPVTEMTTARMSVDSGRRIFRGKSLKENELMRRFVVAEEEAMIENRRRDLMEIVRKRNQMRKRKKLGPSPLSRMVIAEEEDQQVLHQ